MKKLMVVFKEKEEVRSIYNFDDNSEDNLKKSKSIWRTVSCMHWI